MHVSPPPYPSFAEALRFWLKLGFISFGGPVGQVAIMHEYLVEKKKWISEKRFIHALNYCMLLPGPEAQQLATYMGWLLHGTRGGIAAGVLFFLPSALILWILSFLYVTYGQNPVSAAIFDFLKPAVVAIVITAVYKIGKKSLHTLWHYMLAMAAFVAIYFYDISFPLILLVAVLAGVLLLHIFKEKFITDDIEKAIAVQEEGYLIRGDSIIPGAGFTIRRFVFQVLAGIILWCLPFALMYILFQEDFTFWQKLIIFFTKAAVVTVGGAYAVLPYVAQVSVETFGWLTRLEMIDGLALGETTPGPLIMVLAFVGFMAAYNTFGGSIMAATLGLVITTFYTFLPSFLFIFAGAPLIERTHSNTYMRSLLGFISAAVTGVVLNLAVYFGIAVILPEPSHILWIPLAWTIISFFVLHFLNVHMILWLGISVLAGIVKFLIIS